jgi:hypothetical protein
VIKRRVSWLVQSADRAALSLFQLDVDEKKKWGQKADEKGSEMSLRGNAMNNSLVIWVWGD